jgi:hypothetical protein
MCYGGCDCQRCSGEPPVIKKSDRQQCSDDWQEHIDWLDAVKAHDANTRQAIELIVKYGGIDGAHHKDWVLDQVVRLLAGSEYENVIREAKAGEDGPNTYDWDEGIAP